MKNKMMIVILAVMSLVSAKEKNNIAYPITTTLIEAVSLTMDMYSTKKALDTKLFKEGNKFSVYCMGEYPTTKSMITYSAVEIASNFCISYLISKCKIPVLSKLWFTPSLSLTVSHLWAYNHNMYKINNPPKLYY